MLQPDCHVQMEQAPELKVSMALPDRIVEKVGLLALKYRHPSQNASEFRQGLPNRHALTAYPEFTNGVFVGADALFYH